MEMINPIQELLKLIWDPIGKHLKHHRNLDKNMVILHRKLQALNSREEDVESRMKTELHSGKKMKKEVELWLQNVQCTCGELEIIDQEVSEGKYFSRARLGKLTAKKIQEVEELYQKGSFPGSLVVNISPSMEILPTTTIIGETTAKRSMEEVRTCLMDDSIRKIGVYGMGGVGKTTIMKHIYNWLLEETNLFEQVVWVTVPKAVNVFQLQNDIAQAFEVIIPENQNETTRAAKLYSMLRARQRYVLILDDLWEEFYLEDVGIPEPTEDNKCKLVLTTRLSDICFKMECKRIKVPLLSDEEAWDLFLEKARQEVVTSETEIIAKDIAKECGRLPLAIITVARSMKGIIDIFEWRNALEELRESMKGLKDMKIVYEQLKFSYNHLQDERLRQCLLYCALYPKDLTIGRKELIEHLIAEGVIKGISREAELDKGHSMLNQLENACLLERVIDNQNNRWVKMHDLIRDMALQITGTRCLVKAGVHLKEFPSTEEWTENLDKVSLMHNFLTEIPSSLSARCHTLSTLLLSSTHLTDIPNSFFIHMYALQVLDLSDTNIENLPNSLSDLVNLTALLLRGCTKLKYIPSLEKLLSLRQLDLNHTGIKEVPTGIEKLIKLKYLNLYAENLEMLPSGILPKLSSLQFLFVYGASESLKLKGEEVACLRKLETFAGQFYNLNDLIVYVKLVIEQPKSYFIQVGPSLVTIEEEKESIGKTVNFTNCFTGCGREEKLMLPSYTQTLKIEKCHNLSSLNDMSCSNCISKLKSCKIVDCNGIEWIFLLSSSVQFKCLESISLIYLEKLQAFFKGEGTTLTLSTFSALKTLRIYRCPIIKKLFLESLLLHLPKLNELKVWMCEQIEEIIAREEEGERISHFTTTQTKIFLPMLKHLSFRRLPKLKSIYSKVLPCCSLQIIEVSECPKVKRIPLSLPQRGGKLSPPPMLQRISASKELWNDLEWDQPCSKSVLQPFLQYEERNDYCYLT